MNKTHPISKLSGRVALAAIALGAGAAFAQSDVALTIYSTAEPGGIPAQMYRPTPGGAQYGYGYNPWQGQPVPGYAVVRENRRVNVPIGRGELMFDDVAAYIDPTSVMFTSLTDPDGTKVLEQDYRFDLLSMDKMLSRYIDQKLNINGQDVTLLSVTMGGMLVKEADGRVRFMQGYGDVRFPEVASGLITKPTLRWDLVSQKGGAQDVVVAYQTEGITWWADYNLTFTPGRDANSGSLDVGSWVSILNQSGTTYEDAKLKLMGGDVHRAPQPQQRWDMRARNELAMAGTDAPGFEEKSFFEYHLYTLGRPATIPENSTKQIELFDTAHGVPVEKVMVYRGFTPPYWMGGTRITDGGFGTDSQSKVSIFLQFMNSKSNGLGIPLPSGKIRVNQRDAADGSLEFIGEDVIDHTPKDEMVRVKMGEAFDVVGERRQTDFKSNMKAREMIETYTIEVRNHKVEAVKVIIDEPLFRWNQWQILSSSDEYKKQDTRGIQFPVTVPADGSKTVTYTVKYTW